jgi:surfeit locus 1 family protein
MRLTWKLHWPTTLFALALLPLFLGLGRWQLQRAAEKEQAQIAFEQRENAPPQNLTQLSETAELYTRVVATGLFDNAHSFLLDNRILHGRFGYEIITPFTIRDSTRQLLVNRGWIEGDPARRQRPAIPWVEGEVQLSGYVYRDGTKMTFFGNGSEQQWPKLVGNLLVDDLQHQLGVPTYPFILRLDSSGAGALRAEWQIVSSGPERHIAYAVQWFAMALTLVIAWLLMSSNLWQLIRGQHREH